MTLSRSFRGALLGALCLGLCLACAPQGAAPQATGPQVATSALRYDVPLPPTARGPAAAPAPKPATAESAPALSQTTSVPMLTILHTNDSKGYVDPCG